MVALRLEAVLIVGGVSQGDEVALGRRVGHRTTGNDHVTGIRGGGLLQGSGLLGLDAVCRLIAAIK